MTPPPAEDGNGITVSGWGATVEAHGQWVALVLITIAMAVGFAILYEEQIKSEMSEANYFLEIRKNQDSVVQALNKLQAETEVQTWLMSMPFEQRPQMIPPEARGLIERENEATKKLYQNRQKQNRRP